MERPTLERYNVGLLRRKVVDVAADLRQLADDIELRAKELDRTPRQDDREYHYSAIAGQVIAHLANLPPNLALHQMMLLAAQADVARAKRE